MRALDLFSAAAGGWSLGLHRAGFQTVAACEAVEWRRILYAENNPGVRLYDDVRTLSADRIVSDLGYLPDIIVGSPPCQDISSANTKGRGVEGERSGLYFEAIRLVGECRPRWFAFENSANLRTRGADAVLAALEALRYACWPFVVRASDIGANHERARSWLIGFNAHADENGEFRSAGNGEMGELSPVADDPCDAAQVGCGARLPGRRAGAITGAGEPTRWNDADAASLRHEGGRTWRHGPNGDGAPSVAGGERNAPNPDQARQAHGCMESGLRQAEIADDGCCAGWRDDGPRAGQMGLCAPDRSVADRSGHDWSLAHLADHLRLDDGLSARLAYTRIAVSGGRGTSAASLVVEAFGDAVVPQIPEAIGRAILRVEAALAAVHAPAACDHGEVECPFHSH